MKILIKKIHFLVFLIFFMNFSLSQQSQTSCGNIKIEEPFVSQSSKNSSFLKNLVLCRSNTLYFKTSIGLFQISSIDYKNKLLTISHNSCFSSSSNFVSLKDLSLGLIPPPPNPNSLLLFNCLNPIQNTSSSNCPHHLINNGKDSIFNSCKGLNKKESFSFSCLMIDDVQDLGNEFHPKELKCSHYTRVYKSTYDQDGKNIVKFELGTRISWDIDHVPNPCDECRKPHGNCGVGLKCLCHLPECKVEVSVGAVKRSSGTRLFSMIFLIVLLDHLEGVLM